MEEAIVTHQKMLNAAGSCGVVALQALAHHKLGLDFGLLRKFRKACNLDAISTRLQGRCGTNLTHELNAMAGRGRARDGAGAKPHL